MLNQLWYSAKLIFEALKYVVFWNGLIHNIFHSFPLVKTIVFQLYILLNLTRIFLMLESTSVTFSSAKSIVIFYPTAIII